MKSGVRAALLLAWTTVAGAQQLPTGIITTRSLSGQFIISGTRQPSSLASALESITNADLVELEPAPLAIACERLNHTFQRELAITGPWHGKIYMVLHPARSTNELVTVVVNRFPEGWAYQLEVPDVMCRVRFIRALAQVLLLEYANRGAGEQSAEIPVWLTEGVTQLLLDSPEVGVMLPPRRWTVNGLTIRPSIVMVRAADPAETARRRARANPPLSFEGLSWPTGEQFSDVEGDAYRRSAQLFVSTLLTLKDGPACLHELLASLPRSYNWQTAFLQAFQSHFNRLLDVEKWWALNIAQLTGRDPTTRWTLADSWDKLDRIVRTPVQVRAATNELPAHAEVPLQDIIRSWEGALQSQVLQSKSRDLEEARVRAVPEVAALADDYRQLLDTFRQKRSKLGALGADGQPTSRQRRLIDETLKSLTRLEERRLAMRPQANSGISPVTSQAPGKRNSL
jgi:hypothetical protein